MPRIHLCLVAFAVSLGAGALVAQAASPSQSLAEQPTKYKVHRLILADGVVVAGSWSTRNNYWFYYFPDPDTGATEAFDAKTGKPLWQKDITAEQMTASDGAVHIQLANATLSGNKNNFNEAKVSIVKTPAVIGLGLGQGDELWRFEKKEGETPQLQLTSAGPHYVVVTYVMDRKPR
jgi:outer membrane protein assembly factor BamB